MQLILTNPSPRVVRLLERSGVINKIGRDWIFVRVHDAVISCQRSLMQMEAGGTLECAAWRPYGSSGGGNDGLASTDSAFVPHEVYDSGKAVAEGR